MEFKKIKMRYFAALREQASISEETVETSAETISELYRELQQKYAFKLQEHQLKVSVNNQFNSFHHKIAEGDNIVFIPPVAGG